jgi:DNA-binding response OmpR family regulator
VSSPSETAPAPGGTRARAEAVRIILVADDEEDVRTLVAEVLRSANFEVRLAGGGREAVEMASREPPDLVLLDVMMPRKSGYEICSRIRSQPEWRHIKVIMLSAKGRDAEVNKGLTLGADLYVTKPFSTRELLAKIERLLG